MVQLQQPFDARAVAPQSRPEALDEGWYPAVMVSSDLKPTQAGDGGFLELVFDIIDGPAKGRKQYARLNVYNNNEDAVRIATGQLSALCWVTNNINQPVQDTSQLHNIPLQIYVVKRRNERDGGMSNDIKGFRDINGNEPWKQQGGQSAPQGQPQQGQPQGQPPAQPGGWQNQPSGGTGPEQAQPPAGGASQPQGGGMQPGWSGQPQGGGNQPPQGQPEQPHQQPPQQFAQGNGQWGNQQNPQDQRPQQGWSGGNAPSTPPWTQK